MASDELVMPAAVLLVARRAIADVLSLHPPEWEDYPEIGEHDWERVTAEIERVGDQLAGQDELYEAAYRFLQERAE